jgi:hypothetical protein
MLKYYVQLTEIDNKFVHMFQLHFKKGIQYID